MFDDLQYFCTFIGYTHSGHCIVGALLDAHPNIIVANEVDIFERTQEHDYTGELKHPDRATLLNKLVDASRVQAERGRRGGRLQADGTWEGASYAVPGQYQGKFTELRVVGNKRGQVTADAVRADPRALERLRDQSQVPLKIIHVIRNPFDNIASMMPIHGTKATLRYFRRAQDVATVKQQGWDVIDVHLEALIENPAGELERLCGAFDLGTSAGYLDACAAVVMDRPNLSRDNHSWTPAEVHLIHRSMLDYDWLAPYRDTMKPGRGAMALHRLRRKLAPVRRALRSRPASS